MMKWLVVNEGDGGSHHGRERTSSASRKPLLFYTQPEKSPLISQLYVSVRNYLPAWSITTGSGLLMRPDPCLVSLIGVSTLRPEGKLTTNCAQA
jgi:hypothetical protein